MLHRPTGMLAAILFQLVPLQTDKLSQQQLWGPPPPAALPREFASPANLKSSLACQLGTAASTPFLTRLSRVATGQLLLGRWNRVRKGKGEPRGALWSPPPSVFLTCKKKNSYEFTLQCSLLSVLLHLLPWMGDKGVHL